MPSWLKYLSENGRDDMGRENENNTQWRPYSGNGPYIHLVLGRGSQPAGDGGGASGRSGLRWIGIGWC
jgi:hypothetical protein